MASESSVTQPAVEPAFAGEVVVEIRVLLPQDAGERSAILLNICESAAELMIATFSKVPGASFTYQTRP